MKMDTGINTPAKTYILNKDRLVRKEDLEDSLIRMESAIKYIVMEKDLKSRMRSVSKLLNFIVYNSHDRTFTSKQIDDLRLKELCEWQYNIAVFINYGLVCSYDQLRNLLKGIWIHKWQPKEFIA